MLGGDIGRKRREAWAQALERGRRTIGSSPRSFAPRDAGRSARDRIRRCFDAFFAKDGHGDPRSEAEGRIATAGLAESMPSPRGRSHREQKRLIALRDRRRAAQTLERSEALFAVAKAILTAFARAKAERGALDFADQIARALALVTRSSAAWVMHKLDYALDHLLVDEAQDTSAEQWRIVAALTAEFFAGAGARQVARTVFAVGDEKQSIFSFQGAAPEKFAEMRRFFEQAPPRRGAPLRDRAAQLLLPLGADDPRRGRQDVSARTRRGGASPRRASRRRSTRRSAAR